VRPTTAIDDGRIRLVDRLKVMDVSGGENVHPAEIENFSPRTAAVVDLADVAAEQVFLGFAADEDGGRAVVQADQRWAADLVVVGRQ